MRKKPLLLLAFVLVLYIAPSILAPLSYHTAIPTEQNMSKDFSLSVVSDPHFATGGDTGYDNTYVVDSTYFHPTLGTEELEFDYSFGYPIEFFSWSFYGYSPDHVSIYYSDDGEEPWVEPWFEDIEDEGWWNGTLYNVNLEDTGTFYIYFDFNSYIDYASFSFGYFPYESGAWYDKEWGYRKMIEIEGASGAGTNYQVHADVTFATGMQADFDDILFTDKDGVTPLDFWRETYTVSTTASFWVEVKDNLDTDQMIYMYFGNDGASTTSDGVATFLFFDDFELNDLSRWTTSENQWSTSVTQKKYGSYSAFGDSAGTERQLVKTQEINYGVMFHSWSYHEDSVASGANCYIFSSSGGFIGYTDADDFVYNNGTTYPYESDFITTGTWFEYEVGWSTTGQGTFYRNGVEKDTLTILASSPISNIRAMVDTSENIDFYIDDYYMRKWVYVEPIVIVGGHIETAPPVAWQDIASAELVFVVAVDTVGLDMILILGGLILIPCSTLYLVKGRGSEMSSDKFFFFCIAFVMGWALFLGGIM